MAEYILREAARDVFQRLAYDDWNQGAGTTWAEAFAESAELIDTIPAADVQESMKWIPVTERLPETHENVLVRSKFVKMRTDFISRDGRWYTTPGVTHWMPLPEPPKEEE